jgi:hypothetical protein
MKKTLHALALAGAGVVLAGVAQAQTTVTVNIRNLSPTNGTFLTPIWFGFHDGSFDLFNPGGTASVGLERLAEDGELMPLRSDFAGANANFRDTVLFGGSIPPIAPGETVSATITLPNMAGSNRYVSIASMVIPSNDAFIGNANPTARSIFDASGNFTPLTFTVTGAMVWDAGTEVNDEIPANTAFFGQMMGNTGVDQNGVVMPHPGFIPGGPILSSAMFSSADFLAPGYNLLEVSIVPAPATGLLAGVGVLVGLRRRRA